MPCPNLNFALVSDNFFAVDRFVVPESQQRCQNEMRFQYRFCLKVFSNGLLSRCSREIGGKMFPTVGSFRSLSSLTDNCRLDS